MTSQARSTPRHLALIALVLAAIAGCGDDTAAPPGFILEPKEDAGHDAGGDAAQPPAMDASRPDARPEAGETGGSGGAGGGGGSGGMPPRPDDDAGDGCAEDCDALSTQCLDGVCDEESGECELIAKPDGTECGDQTHGDCSAKDTCESGVCDPHHAAPGSPCGDQGDDCKLDDECDDSGQCHDNGLRAEFTPCGDATSTECDAPDSCDALGECDERFALLEAPCGDQDVDCRNDDSCDGAGSCVNNGNWQAGACPPGVDESFIDERCVCGDLGATVDGVCRPGPDVCDDGACIPGHVFYAPEDSPIPNTTDSIICGSADDTECDDPDVCEDGTCQNNAALSGAPCGNRTTDTACDALDSCDGFGNCNPRYADGTTICDDPAGECFDAPRCNGAGACGEASALLADTPCGDPTDATCNGPDVCDGLGACTDGFDPQGTQCGAAPSGACDVADECDGEGMCVELVAMPGTPCADVGVECVNADTCDAAGECIDNGFADPGEPCGSDAGDDCDLPDSCDGAGACDSNPQPSGTFCGTPGMCEAQDTCTGNGECMDNGFSEGCEISVEGFVFSASDGEPIEGAVVELVGADPPRSAVSDVEGAFTLEVPAGAPFLLFVQPVALHWGVVSSHLVLPAATALDGPLYLNSDAQVAASIAAEGLDPIDPDRAILGALFEGSAGGERALIDVACPVSSCGPVVFDALGAPQIGDALLPGGEPTQIFANLAASEVAVEAQGAAGVDTCAVVDALDGYPLHAHTLTVVRVACTAL